MTTNVGSTSGGGYSIPSSLVEVVYKAMTTSSTIYGSSGSWLSPTSTAWRTIAPEPELTDQEQAIVRDAVVGQIVSGKAQPIAPTWYVPYTGTGTVGTSSGPYITTWPADSATTTSGTITITGTTSSSSGTDWTLDPTWKYEEE